MGYPPHVDEASRLVPEKTTRQDASSTGDYQFFDPHETIDTVAGNLPHWRQQGVLYFVTFRTADALPAEKRRAWEEEKASWLAIHPPPWDAAKHAEYLERFPRRLQRWLDAGYGACLLARADLSGIVAGALRHFAGVRYQLDEFVIAPNHVHVLVAPVAGQDLSALLHSWKSYTAKAINRATAGTGVVWQQESYDHIVRNEEALYRIRNYIRNHPQPHVDEASRLVSGKTTRQDASSTG
jgi:REP element-mobilizing transposase RayT